MSSVDMPPKHGNHNRAQHFNSLVIQLQSLGKRQPLYGEDQANAIEIMRSLRRSAFTNEDVSELSGGAWHVPTIKKYTKGEKTQDSTFRDEVIHYLLKMVTMDMTLDRVKEAVSMNIALLGHNIRFADIAALIKECKSTGTSLHDLIEVHKRLVQFQESNENDARDDALLLSFRTLKELFSYKHELDGLGLDIKNVAQIVRAAKLYGKEGDPAAVIEAINKF